MGRIIVSENVSLDGVVQDPNGDEGFTFGGWFAQIEESDREAWAKVEFEEVMSTAALLLGRRGYTWFFTRWASRSGEWADRFNGLPKYIVSSTLENPEWNSTVLHGDVVEDVSKLKQRVAGDIVVFASGRLVHTLLEPHLVHQRRA